MSVRRLLIGLLILGLGACGGNEPVAPRQPASADEVRQLADDFNAVANMQVEAWNSYDTQSIRTAYTDDIVHLDGASEARIEGIDKVASMASQVFTFFPKMTSQVTDQFIASDSGFAVTDISNVALGGYRFTEDDPIIEIDRFETRGDRISTWTLYYAVDTLQKWGPTSPENLDAAESLLSSYRSAWSSGKPSSVGDLYAPDAVRQDTIFNERQEGRTAVESFARSFFAWYPDATWDLILPFGNGADEPTTGGVFAVTPDPAGQGACKVMLAVLLESSDGLITQESVYYEPDSLIACGWAQ